MSARIELRKTIICCISLLLMILFLSAAGADPTTVKTDSSCEVGDIITFGRYEQDNQRENGPEQIECIVLAVEDDTATLISRYGLDAQPFNTEYVKELTWGNCTLRKWLNEDFLKAAFNEEELSRMKAVTVPASSQIPEIPGNDTTDLVYLLSIQEAREYYKQEKGICYPTEYAKALGVHIFDNGASYWWLRTIAGYSMYGFYSNGVKYNHYCAVVVYENGYIYNMGNDAMTSELLIRPVITIHW